MKKCIVIHGCPSNSLDNSYNQHWMPWLKKQLILEGIETEIPTMPEPWLPNYNKFKIEFEKLNIDEKTILIGHSCGGAFITRWLSENNIKISKLILVAPRKDTKSKIPIKKEFYTFEIDKNIIHRVDEIILFTSDNEEDKGKKFLKKYYEILGGKIININNHGHFTLGDMGKEDFPELLDIIKK